MSLPISDAVLKLAQIPSLFDGTNSYFNIASGQVQGELDVYFLSGGDGGLSTTGQVVATTGLQVLGGTSSFDNDLAYTDGVGNFFANGLHAAFLTLAGSSELDSFSGTSNIGLMTNGNATDLIVSGTALSSIIIDGDANLACNSILVGGAITFPDTTILGSIDGTSSIALATDGDASNLNGTIGQAFSAVIASGDGQTLHGTDNSVSGIAAFQGDGSLEQAGIADIQSLLNDSGWTANADAGDKTVVIGSTASLTTIATALNLVSAGAGTALLNIAQKVKALESILAAGQFPNA